jgi:formylglycine-generating enzyme required for sulfatase activity
MSDRLALIIANSEFNDPKLALLATPSRDAEALAQVLRDPAIGNFDVTLLVNKTLMEVRRKIARVYQCKRKDDLVLLYYSGHGIKDEHGDLYLAVKDTEIEIVSATALGAAFVRGQLDKSGSQRKVVLLDCCYGGAFARRAKALLDAGTHEAFTGNGYGRVILTASNAVEYAWEGNKILGEIETSVFTHFLVQGLRTGVADLNGDGKISLDELYDYVYEQVLASDHSKQTPQKWAHKVQGQIVIAQSPWLSRLPPKLHQASKDPSAWMRYGAVGGLARLLHNKDTDVALAAHRVLTRMTDDENRLVSDAATHALNTFMISPIQMELVRVPAGQFLMGGDSVEDEYSDDDFNESVEYDNDDDGQFEHCVHVSEFYIDKHPVTNVQYAAFIEAVNYEIPEHWEKGEIPLGKENHPVVNISWYDAIAFCKWLSRETSQPYRLPTEAEWEKAARGTDVRLYPWGDGQPTAELCNFNGNVGDSTPVGRYSPQGDSPYGCADMAGNVWEWTQSLHKGYPYDSADGREELETSDRARRVVRGGAFLDYERCVRCIYRGLDLSDRCLRDVGFRIVVAPI